MKTTVGPGSPLNSNIKISARLAGANAQSSSVRSEILFVDPSVSALETILGNPRPGVEAIVLDSARPAVRQIAAALDGRHDLRSAHIMAHGAPGRVSFAAGDWSSETLEDSGEDFAAPVARFNGASLGVAAAEEALQGLVTMQQTGGL